MKSVKSSCVYAIKIVISLTTVLLLCVYSVMIKRVKAVFSGACVVCGRNELVR